MARYALILEYDGSRYCGWQRQSHSASVQQCVEEAVSEVANQQVTLVASGRTDTAVHAFAQCAHFDTSAVREHKAWVLGVNAILPADVSVRSVTQVGDNFHARHSTVGRSYRYVILNRSSRSALMADRLAVIYQQLDHQLMHQAAQCLVGEHDFSSFRAAGCQARHAMREIRSIEVSRDRHRVTIEITGNAFLHNMVRIIVGSLIMIGTGRQSVRWLSDVLAAKDRTKAGTTAVPHGLYFMGPDYAPEFAIPDWRDSLPMGPF